MFDWLANFSSLADTASTGANAANTASTAAQVANAAQTAKTVSGAMNLLNAVSTAASIYGNVKAATTNEKYAKGMLDLQTDNYNAVKKRQQQNQANLDNAVNNSFGTPKLTL